MTANPEQVARNLLEDLGITDFPIDPFNICNTLGIKLFGEPFQGIEGVLLFNGTLAAIGFDSRQKYLPRTRFTVSHELGHYSLDIDHGNSKGSSCTGKMIEGYKKLDNIELRADSFASELLMPTFMVKQFFDLGAPSWDSIKEVSQRFEVSLMSSAFKYMTLTRSSCCLVVSKDNYIQFYRPSRHFRYSLQMGDSRTLSHGSFAFKSSNGLQIPQDFDFVAADIWIVGKNVCKDSEVYEWSLPKNSYGQVLTILWDDESVVMDDTNHENPYYIKEKNYSYDGVDNFPWEPPTLGKR